MKNNIRKFDCGTNFDPTIRYLLVRNTTEKPALSEHFNANAILVPNKKMEMIKKF